MFSVIFPGQGSQSIGMAKEIYEKYSFVRDIFSRADEVLGFSLICHLFMLFIWIEFLWQGLSLDLVV